MKERGFAENRREKQVCDCFLPVEWGELLDRRRCLAFLGPLARQRAQTHLRGQCWLLIVVVVVWLSLSLGDFI